MTALSSVEESIALTAGVTRGPVRFDAGKEDIRELKRLVRGGGRALNEQFDSDLHLNQIIPKPWGYEYRAYVDDFFDCWALHVDAPHATSMHVHPRKLTYLLCLGGEGITAGLRSEVAVRAGTIVRIAGGAFHGTRNIGDGPLELIEIEVPRNKFDLLRLRDDYDRTGKSYESKAIEQPEHSMRPVPQQANAHLRANTPDGRFGFEIRTGMDVFYRRRSADLFYVPLCISGVVGLDVEILTNAPLDERRPDVEQPYLCVSRLA